MSTRVGLMGAASYEAGAMLCGRLFGGGHQVLAPDFLSPGDHDLLHLCSPPGFIPLSAALRAPANE